MTIYQNIHFDKESRLIHLWDDTRGYTAFPYKRYAYAKHPDGTFQSMFGDKLKKLHRWSKDTELEMFESDVTPATRTLIDMYTDDDLPSDGHTTLFFDIETEIIHGLPDWKNPINQITSIAIYDTISKEYVVYVLDEKGLLDGEINSEFATVFSCNDEETLLSSVLDKWNEISPTIITGWHCDGFDVPYMYSRMRKVLGEDEANRLSPIGIVNYNPHRDRFFIAGVSSLDYISLYKKFTYTLQPSYALKHIGQEEVNLTKIEYDGNLNDLFESDLEKFIQYNVRDVEIVVKLDEKLDFIELARAICHAGHVPYEDIAYSSRYLDGAVLTFLKRKGVVAPNKPAKGYGGAMGDRAFEGAYVKAPNPGRYEWVYDLDLTSLYPSIIISLNISPETKVAKIQNWTTNSFLKDTPDHIYTVAGNTYTVTELKELMDDRNLSVSSNGVLYNTNLPGVLPEILSEWFDKRTEFKDLAKKYGQEGDTEKYEFFDKRQLVQKILLNSLYGVLGLPVFRFYDLDNALAVTATGQKVIKFTEKVGNRWYNDILDPHEIHIDLENGKTKTLRSFDLVSVIRDGTEIRVLASTLQAGDDLQL